MAEASLRRVSFDPNSISLNGQLKKDVLVSIGQQYDAKALISHQLLFDRDNGSCLREYVQVADATQFEQEKIQVPADTAEKVRNKLLLDAMEQQDLPLLASYMRSLDLTNLESVYAERAKAPPIMLSTSSSEMIRALIPSSVIKTPSTAQNKLKTPINSTLTRYSIPRFRKRGSSTLIRSIHV